MNARTIGFIGALVVCVTVGLVMGAVITTMLEPPLACPEGFVADETYEVCCPEGTTYDPEIDECQKPPVTTTTTDQPSVPTCSEDEYLGADNQCHPKDTPEMVSPDPDTGECPEGYYPCYMTDCCKIPEEGTTRLRGLSMLPSSVSGAAITFLMLIVFVGLWWLYLKPRM